MFNFLLILYLVYLIKLALLSYFSIYIMLKCSTGLGYVRGISCLLKKINSLSSLSLTSTTNKTYNPFHVEMDNELGRN